MVQVEYTMEYGQMTQTFVADGETVGEATNALRASVQKLLFDG